MEFITTDDVMTAFHKSVLGGAKIPHLVSYPVLRKEDGTYYLAIFVQLNDRTLIQKQALRRPSYWYLADITTGAIVREMDCRKLDFCSAPFDRLYKKGEPKNPNLNKADVEEIYAMMDNVRMHIIKDQVLDVFAYQTYLKMIFDVVPSGQINFYRELNRLK